MWFKSFSFPRQIMHIFLQKWVNLRLYTLNLPLLSSPCISSNPQCINRSPLYISNSQSLLLNQKKKAVSVQDYAVEWLFVAAWIVSLIKIKGLKLLIPLFIIKRIYNGNNASKKLYKTDPIKPSKVTFLISWLFSRFWSLRWSKC